MKRARQHSRLARLTYIHGDACSVSNLQVTQCIPVDHESLMHGNVVLTDVFRLNFRVCWRAISTQSCHERLRQKWLSRSGLLLLRQMQAMFSARTRSPAVPCQCARDHESAAAGSQGDRLHRGGESFDSADAAGQRLTPGIMPRVNVRHTARVASSLCMHPLNGGDSEPYSAPG